MVKDLMESSIEDHTFGPTNVREHFPSMEKCSSSVLFH